MKVSYFILIPLLISSTISFSESIVPLDSYQKQGSSCNLVRMKSGDSNDSIPLDKQVSCSASVEDLLRKIRLSKVDDLLIVDTRSASEYDNFFIENSINLPASAIQTKSYWKDKEIYLVGGEKFDLPLLVVCSRLKEKGFTNVKVVAGGINTWVNKRMPVIGNAPNANQLIQLSPEDVWTSRQDITTLYVLDSNYAQFSKYFANSLIIDNLIAKSPENLIKRHQESRAINNLSKVYFLTSSANINNSMASKFNQQSSYANFLFNAKPELLIEYIADFNKLLISKDNGPKKPKCG